MESPGHFEIGHSAERERIPGILRRREIFPVNCWLHDVFFYPAIKPGNGCPIFLGSHFRPWKASSGIPMHPLLTGYSPYSSIISRVSSTGFPQAAFHFLPPQPSEAVVTTKSLHNSWEQHLLRFTLNGIRCRTKFPRRVPFLSVFRSGHIGLCSDLLMIYGAIR
jgi:hypothetical protein